MARLIIPREPMEIKNSLESLIEKIEGKKIKVKYLAIAISQSGLNSYLWNEWKLLLKERGFTWQEFQKTFFMHTVGIEKWVKGFILGSNLINEIEKDFMARL